ncbi:MAG: hypothetical protein WCM76_13805 [Bacteroidota bacterium]
MKRTIIVMSSLVILSCLLGSCKKKDTSTTQDETPAPVVNPLCDGNGSSSYFPLVLNNYWKYYFVGQSQEPTLTVIGTNTYNSKSYFRLEDNTGLMQVSDIYLREVSSSHDIMAYNSSTNSESLYLPGSPTLNQTWAYTSSISRKVTNLSATYTTSSCSYTGLLEITVSVNGSVTDKEYYKKGLGMVASVSQGIFGGMTFKIEALSLK